MDHYYCEHYHWPVLLLQLLLRHRYLDGFINEGTKRWPVICRNAHVSELKSQQHSWMLDNEIWLCSGRLLMRVLSPMIAHSLAGWCQTTRLDLNTWRWNIIKAVPDLQTLGEPRKQAFCPASLRLENEVDCSVTLCKTALNIVKLVPGACPDEEAW